MELVAGDVVLGVPGRLGFLLDSLRSCARCVRSTPGACPQRQRAQGEFKNRKGIQANWTRLGDCER